MNERLLTSLRLGAVAMAAATLPGCVAQVAHAVFSPVLDAAADAALTPESVGISPANWRGRTCEQLQLNYAQTADSRQRFAADGDSTMVKTMGWQLDAINQVRGEQGCLNGTASVAASGQAANLAPRPTAPVAAAPVQSSQSSQSSQSASTTVQRLGMTLQRPSAEMVKALGLTSSGGAWVVSVTPDSPAAKAGLKPLDVILDVSGQQVQAPDDVEAIAGRLRAGYRAALGIWRERGAKELTLEVPAATTVTPVAVAAPVPAPPAAEQGGTFCHAYVYVVNQPGGVQSELFQSPASELNAATMISSLSAFVSKVRQLHPNDWRPFTFAETQCSPAAGYCFGNGENPLFGGKQMAGQFCYTNREQAQRHYDEFNTVKPVYQTVRLQP